MGELKQLHLACIYTSSFISYIMGVLLNAEPAEAQKVVMETLQSQ